MGYCTRHYKQIRRHGRTTPEREHRDHCIALGCEQKHKAHGYCAKHLKQLLTNGNIKSQESPSKCAIIECNKKSAEYGLCQQHLLYYQSMYFDNGYSWEQIHIIIIKQNQKILQNRNRIQLIKERHAIFKKNQKALILKDIRLSEDSLKVGKTFWMEALDEDCDLFEEELQSLFGCQEEDVLLQC
jgi:hypothetical protein